MRVDLHDLGVVWSGDELLQVGETVGLGEGKHQLCFYERLSRLLAGHLQVAHQVLKVAYNQWNRQTNYWVPTLASLQYEVNP